MSVAGLKFVIAGGAEGIGSARAKLAARQDAQVCISDINAEAHTVVQGIAQAGGQAWFIKCDVADESQLKTVMSKAAVHVGGIYGRSLIGERHVS